MMLTQHNSECGEEQNKIVVTLGTPRSGTSAITRGLQVVGVELGDNLMPPSEAINAKGFWEDLDIYALNLEMLTAIKSDWAHVSLLNRYQVDELHSQGFLLRASQLLREKIKDTPIYGFKDPRVAKLLLFWEDVFNHCRCETSYVIALRHPMSIVRSLESFVGMDTSQGYLLWLGYTLSSMTHSAGKKRIMIDYDLLMQAPEKQLSRVASMLGLTVDKDKLYSYKTRFLDAKLRHSVYDKNDLFLDKKCPKIVIEMYCSLLDVAADRVDIDDDDLAQKISLWIKEYDNISVHTGLIDRLFDEKKNLSQVLSERDIGINDLSQAVADRDAQIRSLSQVLAERDIGINDLSQAVAEHDMRINDLSQAVAGRDAQIRNLSQVLAERDMWINDLSQAVIERDAIKSSKSWRVTKPLRIISNLFRRLIGI